ncbi:hypothetical protein GCM10022289_10970 [Pedobacter jeongneungensis]|uniref:Uncharacterized protein n=1 Tax=Pedobacter jeongneungensis TaxID=947309 RepID=A0ABP8B7H9_9SPHI
MFSYTHYCREQRILSDFSRSPDIQTQFFAKKLTKQRVRGKKGQNHLKMFFPRYGVNGGA